jgi:hypothetical protein
MSMIDPADGLNSALVAFDHSMDNIRGQRTVEYTQAGAAVAQAWATYALVQAVRQLTAEMRALRADPLRTADIPMHFPTSEDDAK